MYDAVGHCPVLMIRNPFNSELSHKYNNCKANMVKVEQTLDNQCSSNVDDYWRQQPLSPCIQKLLVDFRNCVLHTLRILHMYDNYGDYATYFAYAASVLRICDICCICNTYTLHMRHMSHMQHVYFAYATYVAYATYFHKKGFFSKSARWNIF